MIEVIVFAVLALAALAAGIAALALGIRRLAKSIRKTPDGRLAARLKRAIAVFGALLAVNSGFILYTQRAASTPAIVDEQGNVLEGSIAELRPVELNGRKQWISIRGRNKDNTVLLFLAGGPGGSQMAAVRHDLAELERHFVVVNWDQPGSGKSYYAAKTADITAETYIEDGYALTNYLIETFHQDKIVLVGESWGSALGIFLIDRHPELYRGFVGTGQMVDFSETERIDYHRALELARGAGDTNTIRKLETNGEPPYYGDGVTWKSAVYLNYLSAHMATNPAIRNGGYNTFRDVFSEEYGLLDRINYFRGIVNTFNHVYPQLYGIDLRKDYAQLKVPVWFFEGRHDINAPVELVEEYADRLDAPTKELVWFEHSGHSPWINQSDEFVRQLVTRFPR